jgi:hypothetical protein
MRSLGDLGMSVIYLQALAPHAETVETLEDSAIYVCRGGAQCTHDGGPCPSCVRLCDEPNATSTAANALGCEVWGAGVSII